MFWRTLLLPSSGQSVWNLEVRTDIGEGEQNFMALQV
jgi:hypothetical protein